MFKKIIDWLDSCFGSSNTSTEDDDEESSKSLPVAKGRLTKAIKRLSKTLIMIAQVRATILDSQKFMDGVRYINSTVLINRSIIHDESIKINKLNSAILSIDRACIWIDPSVVISGKKNRGCTSNCLLLEPRMAEEPSFEKIESNFRKDLFYVEDYEKALRKVNKINRSLEIQVNKIMRVLGKLEAENHPKQGDDSLVDYTLPCLFFLTTPLLTANGNIRK